MLSDVKKIVAVDVETTGLHSRDRILSLGAWRVDVSNFGADTLDYEYLYLILDPGRKSHPRAEEVHGYSDWVLRHQQPFSEYADTVREFLSSGDFIVAHNASFDLEFIDREYRALGQPSLKCNRHCTMNAYRRTGLTGRASLGAICEKIGLKRTGKRHGALEDAWLALMVHYWLTKAPAKFIRPFDEISGLGIPVSPSNFCEPPPMPGGPLPRRKRTDSAGSDHSATMTSTKAIFKEVRPIAILLLDIARADGRMANEEIDILTSLVRSVAERLNVKVDAEDETELLAELLDLKINQNLLTRSARAMYENPTARAEFPKWLATMATVDGDFTVAEREAVDRVKAAIARIMQP